MPQQMADTSEDKQDCDNKIDDVPTHKTVSIHSILPLLVSLPQEQRDAFFNAVELQEFEDALSILTNTMTSLAQMDIVLDRFRQAVATYDYKFFSSLHTEYIKLSEA